MNHEIADSLEKDGTTQPTMNSAPLTYSELHSTYINNKQSTVPPDHHWSGHLRTLTFRNGNKVFPTLVRFSASQASVEHILDCLGLSKQDIYEDPLMVLDLLRVKKIVDLF
ncbi:RNase H domain-containing protein [Trichonephila clavipes]|nr:RNase H domain-containing protein [Trichonephila clavipes]